MRQTVLLVLLVVEAGAKADADATKRENKPIESLILLLLGLVVLVMYALQSSDCLKMLCGM